MSSPISSSGARPSPIAPKPSRRNPAASRLPRAVIETWADLVETPGLVCGSFDPAFLALPEEVLVTSMREHQKVLPIRTVDGAMAPSSWPWPTISTTRRTLSFANERLEARFADARFFFEDDVRKALEDRLPELARLQFQEKLGDYAAKTDRLERLSENLSELLGKPDLAVWVLRAARLMKADLVSSMVREFTDLQGVMGGIYARYQGETEEVWQAVYDQYLPASAEDEIPRGDVGAITAIADRLDTLTGLFGLGLSPTGSRSLRPAPGRAGRRSHPSRKGLALRHPQGVCSRPPTGSTRLCPGQPPTSARTCTTSSSSASLPAREARLQVRRDPVGLDDRLHGHGGRSGPCGGRCRDSLSGGLRSSRPPSSGSRTSSSSRARRFPPSRSRN